MDILKRELAPIVPEAWEEIDRQLGDMVAAAQRLRALSKSPAVIEG